MKALKAAFITSLVLGVFLAWPVVLTVGIAAIVFMVIYHELR